VVSVKRTDGRNETGQPAGDGGVPSPTNDPDLLTKTADEPRLPISERLYRVIDRNILAPLRIAFTDWRMIVSTIILTGFLSAGIFGPDLIAAPTLLEGPQLLPPFESLEFPLGTDGKGRGLLAQTIHATPAMLKMIASGAVLSIVIGSLFGALAGYNGGLVDKVLMFITDTVLTIPGLALVIVLSSFWVPSSPYAVGIILGIDNWPGLARTVRSQVLSIREYAYTEASRAMGLSKLTILRKDVLTDLMPYILVNLANSGRRIIFESVALYYLGILPYTSENWGVMLNTAYDNMSFYNPSEYHWMLVPMVTIVLVSMGFILFAQSMDRVFNVRLRARHEKTTEDDEEIGPIE
jgi:peptide/nickel transport system permease protein